MDCASISIIAERIDLRLVPARTLIKRMQREEAALFFPCDQGHNQL